MDEEMIRLITQVIDNGEVAALVTIIATKGSTPRKAGTTMLVMAKGDIYGTLGGGCIEADIRRNALMAIDEGKSSAYTFTFLGDTAEDEGMVCGGTMEVFIGVI